MDFVIRSTTCVGRWLNLLVQQNNRSHYYYHNDELGVAPSTAPPSNTTTSDSPTRQQPSRAHARTVLDSDLSTDRRRAHRWVVAALCPSASCPWID
jgi:hypothetical protein